MARLRWGARPLLAVATVGVLAAGIVVAVAGNDGPRPATSASPPSGPRPPLEVISPPCVSTDHRSRLSVAFELRNNGAETETLLSVTAADLGSGMRLTRASVHSGRCAAPGPVLPTPKLAPGASVVVVLDIALPAQCPAPYPVGVHVDALGPSGTLSLDTTVLDDLSGLTFRQCAQG